MRLMINSEIKIAVITLTTSVFTIDKIKQGKQGQHEVQPNIIYIKTILWIQEIDINHFP